MPELYHQIRKSELGLPEGTGKRYSEQELNEFFERSFNASLFVNGTLSIDERYIQGLAQHFKDRWKPFEKRLKRNKTLKEQLQDEMINHQVFLTFAGRFDGKVPADWTDEENISKVYQEAKDLGLSLDIELIKFGLIHPSVQVRTTLWETQTLTPQQRVILGFMGISSKNPEVTQRARALATVSMPYMEIAFANEFGQSGSALKK